MRIALRNLLFPTLLAVSALLGLSGCESRAGSNDTARVTALEMQVAALTTRLVAVEALPRPAVTARAADAPAARTAGLARKASALSPGNPCADLGTLTGRPQSGNPIADARLALVACTGYLYVLFDDGQQATLQDLPANAIFYASNDCSGPAYVSRNYGIGLTPAAFRQGAVGRFEGQTLALPAEAATTPIAAASFALLLSNSNATVQCQPAVGTLISFDAVQLVPNDPAMTGVESEPLPSPITVGS